MQLELTGHATRVTLADERSGIHRLVMGDDLEIPFLIPPLTGEHFFTGRWPRPADAIDYEPMSTRGSLTRTADGSAAWHQPETPYRLVTAAPIRTGAGSSRPRRVFATLREGRARESKLRTGEAYWGCSCGVWVPSPFCV